MPQESAQQFANRVLEKGTKIGKSGKYLMNQFVRGLSNECRTHTIALGPNSFAQAAGTASLRVQRLFATMRVPVFYNNSRQTHQSSTLD